MLASYAKNPKFENRTYERVTGWGEVSGFNMSTLANVSIQYAPLPRMIDAAVQLYFELPFLLADLSHSVILKGPQGFLLSCNPPVVKSDQAEDYSCHTCFDFERSNLAYQARQEAAKAGASML